MPYKDPAKNAACKKAYSEKNKEKEATRLKEYTENNREKVRLAKQKWRKANQAHQNALLAKYRATKLKATPIWLSDEQHTDIKELYLMAKDLEKIFPWKQEIDHIIPLQGNKVCGLHVPWNLQILSSQANRKKGNQ